MVCVFVVVLVCTWSVSDLSGWGQVLGGIVCAGCFCVSCPLVSVIWVCPSVCSERRLDWDLCCVW